MLAASQLPLLEKALSDGMMGQRRSILRGAMASGITSLRTETGRVINIRRRDLAEQMVEMRGLRGKNATVIRQMRNRIENEQTEFDASGTRIHAVRAIHLKLLRDVFSALGSATLKAELRQLNDALRQPGIKLGVRKAYNDTFSRLREVLSHAKGLNTEIHTMLTTSFRQLNAEYGFSLQTPHEPELVRYQRDLEAIERSHLQYLGIGNVLRLAQPEFSDRLVRALATRLRVVYESALGEVELWNKTAAAQLDAQLRERRKTFARRIEAIDRIQDAANTLDERIAEINSQDHHLTVLYSKLLELTSHLVDTPADGQSELAVPATVAKVVAAKAAVSQTSGAQVALPGAKQAAAVSQEQVRGGTQIHARAA